MVYEKSAFVIIIAVLKFLYPAKIVRIVSGSLHQVKFPDCSAKKVHRRKIILHTDDVFVQPVAVIVKAGNRLLKFIAFAYDFFCLNKIFV